MVFIDDADFPALLFCGYCGLDLFPVGLIPPSAADFGTYDQKVWIPLRQFLDCASTSRNLIFTSRSLAANESACKTKAAVDNDNHRRWQVQR